MRAHGREADDTQQSGTPLVAATKGNHALSSFTALRRAALASIAACGLVAAPAHAAATASEAGCAVKPTTTPFAPWGDLAAYVPAPGGDLEEAGSTWTLRGRAGAVEGNEPFRVGAPTDHLSLSMQPGSSAATAPMCIGIEHRTLRFFARGSERSGSLQVEVLYAGGARTLGTIDAATTWAPTDVLPMVVNELAPATGNAMQVAFRFTPRGSASWSIDDVYVDPFRSR